MAIFDELLSKQLQSILAWGSVTYGLGFVTVMLHTARLGIPIIQLLEPVYVLVGAPLAVVVFFSRELWRLITARTAKLKSKLKQIKAEVSEIRARPPDIVTREDTVKYLIKLLQDLMSIKFMRGFMSDVPLPLLLLAINYVISLWKVFKRAFPEPKMIDSLSRKIEIVTTPKMIDSLSRKIEIVTNVYRGIIEFSRYLGFIILVFTVPVSVYLYVIYISFSSTKPRWR